MWLRSLGCGLEKPFLRRKNTRERPNSKRVDAPKPPSPKNNYDVVQSEPEVTSLEIGLDVSKMQERLWNLAYDGLKEKGTRDAAIVDAYEKILSQLQKDSANTTEIAEQPSNDIGQTRETRWRQMEQLVHTGLQRTQRQAEMKERVDNGLKVLYSLKDPIQHALRSAPEASVAWAGISIGLEILVNPLKEPKINRKGISYVLSRMNWYWNLADLLLDKHKSKPSSAMLKRNLETEIIQLYKKLLLYEMRSICVYFKSWVTVLLRDIIQLDDWEEQIQDIKEAEMLIKADAQQFTSEEVRMSLASMEAAALSQEIQLQSVYAAINFQTERQEEGREDERNKRCLRDLYLTHPREDRLRIQEMKGGRFKESYRWILEHHDLRQFVDDPQGKLLWIKGDPGKGKTMLLCGIAEELEKTKSHLSYFFCQASEAQLASETAVLRGLIYLLVEQNPALISSIRPAYDIKGVKLFEGINASIGLREILIDILQDPSLHDAVLIVDALDECTTRRNSLTKLIVELSESCRAKWIVSSRNWPDLEQELYDAQKVIIQLELNGDSVIGAVHSYIRNRVTNLARRKGFDEPMKTHVEQYLISNCNDTFLWVSLVCQRLAESHIRKRNTLIELSKFPQGLESVYGRMLDQIMDSPECDLWRQILATACVAYRPITIKELRTLVQELQKCSDGEVEDCIESCASFLTQKEDVVYFVHETAKTYLLETAPSRVFPSRIPARHYEICMMSLKSLRKNLKRDVCCLASPARLVDANLKPKSDPLAGSAYSCVYWVNHLIASGFTRNEDTPDLKDVCSFLEDKFLYWVEALSILRGLSIATRAIIKLEAILSKTETGRLGDFFRDARRFILYHKQAIEAAPLQVYASALIFSPKKSRIRQLFRSHEPDWISLQPRTQDNWDTCLQTLPGDEGPNPICCIKFSPAGRLLASGSAISELKIWDVTSGDCLKTMPTLGPVLSVDISPDGNYVAAASGGSSIEIWNMRRGIRSQISTGMSDTNWLSHDEVVLFSPDGNKLASASNSTGYVVQIWDLTTGACTQALDGHEGTLKAIDFSPDGRCLATGSRDNTAKIWDLEKGACKRTLLGHGNSVGSVAFSGDGTRLATGSYDGTARVWDAVTGTCLQILEGHRDSVISVHFLNSDVALVSGSFDSTIKFWDTRGTCIETLSCHDDAITTTSIYPKDNLLASGSFDKAIKIWDISAVAARRLGNTGHDDSEENSGVVLLPSSPRDKNSNTKNEDNRQCVGQLEGHSERIESLRFSPNGEWLASRSDDRVVKIWDVKTSSCVLTNPPAVDEEEGDISMASWIAFSTIGPLVAFEVRGGQIAIWDLDKTTHIHTLDTRVDTQDTQVLVDLSLALSVDGKLLASGSSKSNRIRIWDVATETCLKTLKGHDAIVPAIVFSGDAKLIASGGDIDSTKIWNVDSGDCIQTFRSSGYEAPLAFSSDGQWLVSQEQIRTNSIQARHIATGFCINNLQIGQPTNYPSFGSESDLRFSTDFGDFDLGKPGGRHDAAFVGYGVRGNRAWIMRGKENMLWIPDEYRTLAFTTATSRVAFGNRSGRITLMQLT